MADTKVTILGMSGAGKTCYLLGLYYMMTGGIKGYTISSDEDTDVELRNRYSKLCDVSLSREERFPVGTDNISKYSFELQYGFEDIMSFEWLDYPGGLLSKKNTQNYEDYEDIKNSINQSSSLLICVDGALLVGNDVKEKIKNVKNQCSNVINSFFTDYLKYNKELPPTSIVITKYDICREEVDEDEIVYVIKESFSPFFIQNGTKKIVSIIPVSIGIDITEHNGVLNPVNLHLPIFGAIWFAMGKKMKFQNASISQEKRKYESEISMYQKKLKQEEAGWFIFKNHKEIEKLKRIIADTRQIHQKYLDREIATYNKMSSQREKLITELESIKLVFVDGKQVEDLKIFK